VDNECLDCLRLRFQGQAARRDGANGPGGGAGWTELFFLDEATALAAGHRPCFHCRRDDAKRFQAAWAEGNGVPIQKAPEMDAILHRERLDGRAKRLHPLPSSVNHLPDGAMIASGTGAFLIRGGKPLRWSFEGYQSAPSATDDALLLTPPSTLRALKAGYRPVLHASSRTDAGT
jgi:hypothetical protein